MQLPISDVIPYPIHFADREHRCGGISRPQRLLTQGCSGYGYKT
jgi:hypothetical protein